MTYRPWGAADWVLSLSRSNNWHFVGALGTTERSLCAWNLVKGIASIQHETIIMVEDVDSEKHRVATLDAYQRRVEDFVRLGGRRDQIKRFELMVELFRILELSRSIGTSSAIILDITSLPKRFFFPLLRALVTNPAVDDLVVAYSSPARYTDEPLYEDIEPWRPLPGFGGTTSRDEHWIISVGFLVESLRQYIADTTDHEPMKLLIPYPSPLAISRRTWESLVRLEGGQFNTGVNERFEKYRVDSIDMSAAFDRIVSLAGASQKRAAFAPFGPKPISAAMCLYATAKGSGVYYPQPTVYNPNYAIGIRDNDPLRAVTTYWIKHQGNNFYTV